jgi:stage II sporulation protein D
MKLKQGFSRKTSTLTMAAFLMAGSLFSMQTSSYGAVPKLEQIRVALFIDSSKFKSIEPVVTLSVASGLDISLRGSAAAKTWINIPSAATVRGSLDQYSAQMLETADLAAAKALYTMLSLLSGDSYILTRPKQGKELYQVYYGSYATSQEASTAKDQALRDPNVAALVKSAVPTLSGPYRWNAGTYVTEAEAVNQLKALSQSGLNADMALQEDSTGKLTYSVWIGNVASPEQLATVKQQFLAQFPNIALLPVSNATPYLVKRMDTTTAASAADAVPHYAVGGSDAKFLIHPKQGEIGVKERSGRAYRGDMELSSYNGDLALINEVPFEQYLYSVVSSELGANWPTEALKAQAIAARTYALKQGMKYQIAQISDTTLDQAYFGKQKEFDSAIKAVEATRGEVIVDKDGLITPFYSSNSGGVTADPSEIWGNPIPYIRSVPSPDDGASTGKAIWYEITLADGNTGYVHSSYLKSTGQNNAAGQPIYEATETGVNVRHAPFVDNTGNPSFGQLNVKEKVTVIGQETESNAYSWVRIFDAAYLQDKLAASGTILQKPLESLEITKRGPSGRALELKANGQIVQVQYPDALRSALGGLPSTRFEIESTGGYTKESTGSLYVLGANQTSPMSVPKSQVSVIGASGEIKLLPKESEPSSSVSNTTNTSQSQKFVFKGKGSGHGLGMSQWGAKGYAELGYDYKKILQTYYYGVNITKE